MIRVYTLASVIAASVLSVGAAAHAGDGSGLKLPGDPGLLYEFNARTSRGVDIEDNATLELRFDGCWTAETFIRNTTDHPRTVSVSVEFRDEDGRPLDAVPAVFRETIAPQSEAMVRRRNCSKALEASYSLQRCWTVRRIVSTR